MIEHLYATLLYHNMVADHKILNYQIDKVIDKIEFNMKDDWGATHYLSTDFAPNVPPNILKELGLRKLSQEIDKHIREYCSELRFEVNDYTVQSWFSKFEKRNYAHIHDHGEADISGVYYYKTNGKDGNLFFQTPNPYHSVTKCYLVQAIDWEHQPIEGKILLFPGWLKHGVRTNMTDNTRISLSFNIYFSGIRKNIV